MGFHLRGELLKILIGGSRGFRRCIRFAKECCDRFYLSPSFVANGKAYYSAAEVKAFEEMRHRYQALMYWRALREGGMTRRDAAAWVGHHRDTLARWEARWRRNGEYGLLTGSRARHHPPSRTARTAAAVAFVLRHRQQYTDGKVVLCELMRRAGFVISPASVGRIIAELRERHARGFGRIQMVFRQFGKKRRLKRRHAKRCRYRPLVGAPGYVQVDHKQVIIAGVCLRVFGVRDVYTKAVYVFVTSAATAASAWRALQYAQAKAGYRFTDVQTDNGSEFMGVFEDNLRQCGIRHHLIPVRSPKWNSLIENAFGYMDAALLNGDNSVAPTVGGLQAAVERFFDRYNDKPNMSLSHVCPDTGKRRYRTPNELRYNALSSLSSPEERPPSMPSMVRTHAGG